MQRIINNPDMVVEDSIKGYVSANPSILAQTDNPKVLKYAGVRPLGKVGVITGGGSGHEPAFLGYVGQNLLDAVAIGEIFSSPTAVSFLDAATEADQGAGVACLYGNYAGDNMNVKMAVNLAKAKGIEIKTVVANDDVASASQDEFDKRRGVAGEILMWKVGGASAARGDSLDEVIAHAQKAIDNTRSIGIGLSSCTIPAVGKPNFQIEDGKMEVGIGHHGEPGIDVRDLSSSKEIAEIMVERVIPELEDKQGNEVVVILSGLGSTPDNELNILYADVFELLKGHGMKVHKAYVGNYFTSLEMAGATLTVMKLDENLKALIDMPAKSLGLIETGDI